MAKLDFIVWLAMVELTQPLHTMKFFISKAKEGLLFAYYL